jgi:hypothetical protein
LQIQGFQFFKLECFHGFTFVEGLMGSIESLPEGAGVFGCPLRFSVSVRRSGSKCRRWIILAERGQHGAGAAFH